MSGCCASCWNVGGVGPDGLCPECREETLGEAFSSWLRDLRALMVQDGMPAVSAENYGWTGDWVGLYRGGLTPRQALDQDYAND